MSHVLIVFLAPSLSSKTKCGRYISRAQLYTIYSYLQPVPKSFCTSYVYIKENPNNVPATLSFRTKRRCQKHNEHMAHLTADYIWVYIYSIPLLYKLNIHAIDLKLYSGTHKGAQGL
jgi:hypothetical protein